MTARSVQALRHVGFEDIGSFEAPLRAAGYYIEYVDVAERDPALLDPLSPDLWWCWAGQSASMTTGPIRW